MNRDPERPKICLGCARRKLAGQKPKACATCAVLNIDPLAQVRATAKKPSPLAGIDLDKPMRAVASAFIPTARIIKAIA